MLVMGVTTYLHGSVIPIDNFNAMDPTLPGWTKVDLSAGQPWGPGVYDPSSGALRIYHSGSELVTPGAPFTQTAMFALWNNSTDPLYSNGFLRAKIRTDETNANTALEMRLDLSTATAYLLFDLTVPYQGYQGWFAVHKFVNGVETSLWESFNDGIEYVPGENWNMELGTVGNQISAKVWKVGAPEPPMSQFSITDPDPISGGMIGISSDKVLGVPVPARADSTFDDIVFNGVPEPSSFLLILLGVLALTISRRL
jgi:hypothetical protein